MITELSWDSKLFKRKIGRLSLQIGDIHDIPNAVKEAKARGFRYLSCRLEEQETRLIGALESEGFYLTDIGVTFEIKTAEYLSGTDEKAATKSVSVSYGNQALAAGAASGVVEATEKDISDLKKMIPSLFPESRFYHDPFYSRKEADDLYRAWMENSVRGEEADVVLHIPRTGFITCKKVGRRAGKIVLIGVKRGKRGRGLGTALLLGAMKWFAAERVSSVTVRTQLKNVIGMNFYLHCGFLIKEYDLIFAKIM